MPARRPDPMLKRLYLVGLHHILTHPDADPLDILSRVLVTFDLYRAELKKAA